MKPVLQFFRNLIKHHKTKIAIVLLAPFVFFHLSFDYGSLSGLVSEYVNRIYAGSQGMSQLQSQQIRLDFDDVGLHLFPIIGIGLVDLSFEMPSRLSSDIQMGELIVGPEWRSLFSFRPGINLALESIWGGDLQLMARSLKGKSDSERRFGFNLDLNAINLKLLEKNFQIPVAMTGSISGVVDGEADLAFGQQPQGTIDLIIDHFGIIREIEAMGLAIPPIKIKTLSLKGKIKDGKITIEQLKAGQEGDDLFGTISGEVDVKFPLPSMAMLLTMPLRYQLTLDLSLSASLESKLGPLLAFTPLGKFKSQRGTNTRYALKLSGQSLMDPALRAESL